MCKKVQIGKVDALMSAAAALQAEADLVSKPARAISDDPF